MATPVLEHRLILHAVTLPSGIIFAVLGFLDPNLGIKRTLIGGAFGFVIFLILYLLGGLFSRWAGRKKAAVRGEVALGFGDVTLATLIGLAVGFPGVIEALQHRIPAAHASPPEIFRLHADTLWTFHDRRCLLGVSAGMDKPRTAARNVAHFF